MLFAGKRLTIPASYAFSRPSNAFDSQGRQFDVGIPRYGGSPFGYDRGILVEEGTTNIVPQDSNWSVGNLTFTGNPNQFLLIPSAIGAVFYRGINGTYDQNSWITASFDIESTTSYQISVKMDENGAYNPTQVTINITPGKNRYSFNKQIIGTGVYQMRIVFYPTFNGTLTPLKLGNIQMEKKSFPTTFIDGSRSIDTLTVPMAGMPSSAGTFELLVYINSLARRQDVNNRIINLGSSSGNPSDAIRLFHLAGTSTWQVFAGSSGSSSSSDSATPDGWYLIRITWQSTLLIANFYSLATGNVVLPLTISYPYLPQSFATNAYIGSGDSGTLFLNTMFDNIRLSNIVRTDTPDLTKPLQTDANTVLKVDFIPQYNHLSPLR